MAQSGPTAWFKANGTRDDFERARGRCLAQAELAQAVGDRPFEDERQATWTAVFQGCMAGAGWTFAARSQLPPGAKIAE